jgi:hypothetical protein
MGSANLQHLLKRRVKASPESELGQVSPALVQLLAVSVVPQFIPRRLAQPNLVSEFLLTPCWEMCRLLHQQWE